ncbi:MAG: hypothetical protein A2020_08235 [Lentisphaerae bacterium GWF2_45_14]|nr:MAG: hypothetical protein A2020_08235 [Lentisphaerae bacterium GWF2_45_14]
MDSKIYDVIVCGGGPGGVCAAMAAARSGMKTLMIERYAFAGGMATAGLVNPFMSYVSANGKNLANGIFNEIIAKLAENGGIYFADNRVFDDEIMKLVLDEMLMESGVEILFHAHVCGAKRSGGKIESVSAATKSGIQEFKAKIFIDATGDGDLAYYADFKYEKGRSSDGACQPSTLCFRIGGVRTPYVMAELRAHLTEVYLEGKAAGKISDPRENVLIFNTLRDEVIHFNTTRVVLKDSTLSKDLTDSELEARKQTKELFTFFKEKSPYFKNAYILKMAAQIGVRETRRVEGLYKITEDELLKAKHFDDAVARSNYPVDIHNPAGSGTVIKRIEGEFYEIPYRCLVPLDSTNLLMACRAISSTHEAHSSLRIMPVVASYGEAAGIAAAIAVKENKAPAEIDGRILKEKLFKD